MATISRDMKDRKDGKEKEPKRRRPIKTEGRSASPTPASGVSEAKKIKTEVKHTPPPVS